MSTKLETFTLGIIIISEQKTKSVLCAPIYHLIILFHLIPKTPIDQLTFPKLFIYSFGYLLNSLHTYLMIFPRIPLGKIALFYIIL